MFSIDTCKYFRSMLSVSLSPSSNVSNQLFSLCDLASSFFLAVLMDPAKRFEYDFTGIYEIHKYTLREYLARFKGMILTCNGLGISQSSSPWTHQLAETTKQQTSKVGFLFLFSLLGISNLLCNFFKTHLRPKLLDPFLYSLSSQDTV
jgi:hypothetical protein